MLTTILIGAAIGAGLAVAVILGAFELRTKEGWKEEELKIRTLCMRVFTLTAENAQLRVALATDEMTEDGKNVAAMTMAALDAVKAAAQEASLGSEPRPVTAQEGSQEQERRGGHQKSKLHDIER